MTACSSILALGMMPLCLFIYTSMWTSANTIQIPYDSIGELMRCLIKASDVFRLIYPHFSFRFILFSIFIIILSHLLLIVCDNVPSGITLLALLIPIAVGMYVKRRWPLVAKKILRVRTNLQCFSVNSRSC